MGERKDQGATDGANPDTQPRAIRDSIDLNDEMAGRDTGRAKRFLPEGRSDDPNSEKHKAERRFNALMRMLQDPAYARLYSEAEKALSRAENALNAALEEIRHERDIASKRLEELRAAAATLPDGRKVFRAKDGRIYTEDGEDVTAQRDKITGLTASSPGCEDYEAAKKKVEDLDAETREHENKREEVETAQERMHDPGNPPSQEELELFKSMEQEMSDRALKKIAAPEQAAKKSGAALSKSAADEYAGPSNLNAPDLAAHFSAACSDEPYGSSATQLPTAKPKF